LFLTCGAGKYHVSPSSILEEIGLLAERGVREITLLGQNVNSYSVEHSFQGKLAFPGLLRLVAENLNKVNKGIRWVRFLSSHPKDLSGEAIRVLAENPCFCRHIHLPVQHGSDSILQKMNRRYSRKQYLDLVKNLRAALPDLSLSTDILVGFPGETEEDLDAALSLMEEVKFLYAYMYHYNPREGTAAYSLDGRISSALKRERLLRVIALQKRHTSEQLKKRIGQNVSAFIEGISRKNADELVCRTERDEMIVAPGKPEAIGSFASLTVSSIRGNTFRGSFV
jgi:tRNA-2-methylthio-N6-dimethylallyladenosine synthase